jgi:hypothetical protein
MQFRCDRISVKSRPQRDATDSVASFPAGSHSIWRPLEWILTRPKNMKPMKLLVTTRVREQHCLVAGSGGFGTLFVYLGS